MTYKKYVELVDWYFNNDNREVNYQNRILIPFLEELLDKYDIVDTSMLTKEWRNRNIGRDKFAGIYTPDILIATDWKLKKEVGDVTNYKALIEIKTPAANDRKHAESEVKEYLKKVPFVILTDCITWEFFMKEDGKVYKAFYSLEESYRITHLSKNNKFRKILKLKSVIYEFPTRVCERYVTPIKWNDKNWDNIIRAIKTFKIDKTNTLV